MLLEQFMESFAKIKKGRFTTCVFEKNINGYVKTTKSTIRFVKYGNLKAVKEKAATSQPSATKGPNPNIQVIIPDTLIFNKNTNNFLVYVYTCPNGKKETTYKNPNGATIDKETFEKATSYKSNGKPTVMFQIKLQELVSLG